MKKGKMSKNDTNSDSDSDSDSDNDSDTDNEYFDGLLEDLDPSRTCHIVKTSTVNRSKIIETKKSIFSTEIQVYVLREELEKFEKERGCILEIITYISLLKDLAVPPQLLGFEKFTEEKMNLIRPIIFQNIDNKCWIFTVIMSDKNPDLKIIMILINHIRHILIQFGELDEEDLIDDDSYDEALKKSLFRASQKHLQNQKILVMNSKMDHNRKSIISMLNKITSFKDELTKLKEKKFRIEKVLKCINLLKNKNISPKHLTFKGLTDERINLIGMICQSRIDDSFILPQIISNAQVNLKCVTILMKEIQNFESYYWFNSDSFQSCELRNKQTKP